MDNLQLGRYPLCWFYLDCGGILSVKFVADVLNVVLKNA